MEPIKKEKVAFCQLTDAATVPKYLWPLSGQTNGFEVVHSQDGISPNLTDCPPVGPGHPTLGYTSLYFDGTQYVDVAIPSDPTIKDSVFTAFIKSDNGNGFIFHYRADDQNTGDFINNMYVQLTSGNVFAKMDVTTSGVTSKDIPRSGQGPYSIVTDQWTMIAFLNNFNASVVSLYIDVLRENSSYPTYKFPLQTPGVLRFGGGQSPAPLYGFTGFITGAALYNTASDMNVMDLLQNVNSNKWPSTPPDRFVRLREIRLRNFQKSETKDELHVRNICTLPFKLQENPSN
ncbi:hypothetical protein LOTGIDRAFT_163660 [Lottia gigantea]|uniref:Laminin G domain-containing protein n=1 Tax=Lottia gigantea TaxID=225164 RepID=V3ZHN2_LOTGI|nr:hypothetical protein LOTGIDRAFT_163660 [Lottia gigantea]ESO90778.1 hypothetical protein LOTGIDRAFT_163660 [Lottia gigantea]